MDFEPHSLEFQETFADLESGLGLTVGSFNFFVNKLGVQDLTDPREHSRCCWLEGAKPNIVVTKRDVTTRIYTYNGGLMWFTETVQIVPKTRKTLQTHFSIIPDFF